MFLGEGGLKHSQGSNQTSKQALEPLSGQKLSFRSWNDFQDPNYRGEDPKGWRGRGPHQTARQCHINRAPEHRVTLTASNAAHVELVGDEFCRWGHGTLLRPGGEVIIRRALQERLIVHI